MATRYERYNEITFDAYCKAAVDKAILKERLKKAARGQPEQSWSHFQAMAFCLLRYFRDMRDEKIASCLGMANSTVHRKRRRVKAKLRILLEAGHDVHTIYCVIEAAKSHDVEAADVILRHFEDYMLYKSLNTYEDEFGNIHSCVDDDFYYQARNVLLSVIFGFCFQEPPGDFV